MATYQPPKINTQWIGYVSLVSQASTLVMQSNPTIAAGDFKVSIDGGALANLGTLPAVTPASSKMVKITLSTSEMNGANITVVCSDAAGAEWCDLVFNLQTSARQIDDLAYPATSGRSMVVDASGLVDANTVKVGPTGSGTAQTAKDIGGAVPAAAAGASGGLLISGSNSGTTTLGALTITGATTHTGNMVLSDGLTISAPSTSNRAGLDIAGNGTGAGIKSTGGATGAGISAIGGGTSGDAILTATTSGHGITAAGTGTTKHGINATGGSTTSHGISATGGGVGHGILATSGGGSTGDGIKAVGASTNGNGLNLAGVGTGAGLLTTGGGTGIGLSAVGGGTSGDGIKSATTSGHGLNLAPVGTSKHGIFATGGNGGTSDGISAVAGTGGVPIRGDLTGNITGNLSGSAGSVTGAVGSVTARVTANTDQLAGQTVTAAAGVTFPTSVASPTNITAGTITTATNVTTVNGLAANVITAASMAADAGAEIAAAVWTDTTAGDFTVALSIGKSIMNGVTLGTGLTIAAVSGAVGSVTGNVGGSVASVQAGGINAADKTGYRLSATGVDDIHDEVVEGTTTMRQSTRLANSANGSKVSGAATATAVIRDIGDTKDRITATVDANGNRSAVTLDLT